MPRPETLADLEAPAAWRPPSGHRHRAPGRRGKHARPADPLAITVKALNGPERPPVTGSHRAPGTLPIESWVLAGKPRQQALLGALVAVGLTLVMIPVAGQDAPADPVNAAAGQSVVGTEGTAGKETGSPPAAGGKPAQAGKPAKDKPATPGDTAPAQADPSAPPPAPSPPVIEPPIIDVPPGDGPHRSLRTTGSRTVALTFDDGPDPVHTPAILAILAEHRVTATFCLVGEQVQKHPEIVRQIVADGHTLCNHTWDHSLIIGTDKPARIRADLQRTTAAIQAAAPGAEVPFFRAPGGNFSDRLVQVAYAEGMRSLYWEVDPRDWQHGVDETPEQHVERLVTQVKREVRPGAIVLSHDFNQPETITAYGLLLPWLTERFELGVPPVGPPPPSAPPSGDASAPAGR
jgi:peptidoglycan/xylan/chitin deacetylase (PgdA/CDA1 family)